MLSLPKASHVALASVVGVAVATYLLYHWMKQVREPRRRRKRMPSQDAVVVETIDALEAAMTRIVEDTSNFKVIGLDCEWCSEKCGRRRPVALLQLATASGYSVLVRLCKMDSHNIPDSLRDLLADRSILKVGVAVLDDANRLLQDHHLQMRGCLDLRHLASRHMQRDLRPKFTGGLGNLAEVFLDESLDKSYIIRCGNWEADVLSLQQVKYGAQDVIVAVEIFLEIIHRKLSVIPDQPNSGFWSEVGAMCQGLVDVKYKTKTSERKTNTNVLTLDHLKLVTSKVSNAYKPRQTQMYHNCRLIAPDGEMLCTCHRQKAEWYIKKGIGVEECQEPFTVRLNFEPSGMPGLDRAYYLQDKANMCVVCGRADSYIRKNIVPHEYRRHFPEKLKKHTSHDVLLLCLRCHQISSSYDRVIRQQLIDEYNAPITNSTNARYREDPEKIKARSAAKALQRHRRLGQLPKKRVAELETFLLDFWNVEKLDGDLIGQTIGMAVKCENADFTGSHGDKVVAIVMKEEGGIEKFECRWRQNFLTTMKPQFMPALWSVHHRHKSGDSDTKKEKVAIIQANILKVGVAVLDDANRLLQDHHLQMRGCLDLRHLASRHMQRDLRPKFTGGLGNLAEVFLDESLDKSYIIRCGNWEADVLSLQQVKYGAQDVIVAVEIFLEIIHRKLSVIPDQPNSGFWSEVGAMCQGLVDVKYKTKTSERKTNTNVLTLDHLKLVTSKVSNAYKPRQTQMYHNCRLIAPDGEMLCTCHRQKAEWYIKKGIGVEECQEPFTVRLNFEPSGMPGLDRAYYLQDKANMCVVCGRADSYIRKNIVPHEYRRHFPEKLKKHTSHDVLLLCLRCHQISSSYDRVIRQQLIDEYNAPITNSTNARYREDPEKIKARSAAKALQRHRRLGQLPKKRVAELETFLLDFWNVEKLDGDLIGQTIGMAVKCENADFTGSHGDKVVAIVMKEEGGIEKFECRWRQNFLTTMKPQFMPALWSVHHRHKSGDSDTKKEKVAIIQAK